MRALTGAVLGAGLVAAALQSPAVADGSGSPAAGRPVEQTIVDDHLPTAAPAQPSLAAAPAAAAIACDGNGVNGKRVQLLYVRGDATADRFDQLVPEFRTRVDHLNARYARTSDALGGHRAIRFVQNPSTCEPVVERVVIPQSAVNGGEGAVHDELARRGYNNNDRKYLTWVESTTCGLAWGGGGGDDRPGQDNPATGTGIVLVGINGCWDNRDVDVHELTHTLGAVKPSAKYSTSKGHCYVNGDLLCYDDGGIPNPPGTMIDAEPDCHPGAGWIDCTHDMYFNPNPAPGSYLASHWNVANSPYLIAGPAPTLPTTNVTIVNARTGFAADVDHSRTTDGTRVMSWAYSTGDRAERWNLEHLSDGRYRITPVLNTGSSLDANNDRSRTVDGTSYFAQLWGYAGTDNQKWTLRSVGSGKYEIVGADGGCLTSSTQGVVLGVWQCTGDDNQRWRVSA
ncbi:RICIN domain-containing protein [Kitasatospora sp. NPDC002543]